MNHFICSIVIIVLSVEMSSISLFFLYGNLIFQLSYCFCLLFSLCFQDNTLNIFSNLGHFLFLLLLLLFYYFFKCFFLHLIGYSKWCFMKAFGIIQKVIFGTKDWDPHIYIYRHTLPLSYKCIFPFFKPCLG